MAEPTQPPSTAGPIDWPAALAEHGRWLRTAVFARLGAWPAVDEVMQEVSLAAVALRAGLCDPARAGAWLYRVAVKQALLYRRRQGRRQKLIGGYARTRGDGKSDRPDPLELLLLDERKQMVREALASLARLDAEILLLKYTEDWSCRELAQRLGVSESCMDARLHRARNKLRQAILETRAIGESE